MACWSCSITLTAWVSLLMLAIQSMNQIAVVTAAGFSKDGSLPSVQIAQSIVDMPTDHKRFKELLRRRVRTLVQTSSRGGEKQKKDELVDGMDEGLLSIAGDRLAGPTVFTLRIGRAAVLVSVAYNDPLKAAPTGMMFWRTPELLCALVGRVSDMLACKRLLRAIDEQALARTGQRLSAAQLALKLADDAQVSLVCR
jgi:hypothetical protein